MAGAIAGLSGAAHAAPCAWPQYDAWLAKVMQNDGRALDVDTKRRQSTSEGQSYAMFFALVANDRATFDRALDWTRRNLAGGVFGPDGAHLPAWQWGRRDDGNDGVVDPNSASDSDLWLAYDLLEAGRLWRESGYTRTALALMSQIRANETVALPGVGTMLLPGSSGFYQNGVARVNPSYTPAFVLRRLALEDPQGPWTAIATNATEMMRIVSPRGYAPDWAAFRVGQGYVVDPVAGDAGSYDAIRTYLWAALTARGDPLGARQLAILGGMRAAFDATAALPERVATLTGVVSGTAPVGFWAALLPYFNAFSDARGIAAAQQHLASDFAQARYYDRALALFGTGAFEQRYRFDVQGRLEPRWEAACQSDNAR
ncbi:cellulose synthase complex periplasmic endoglucanase BcsZ [Pararobbsia silviterrae]|uniref:cellulase n=1 Tax=Pararobbsia silviterrae TaxID=1792498 RepID=A0A494XD74_9BURK|nr:cellulase [Pararobbsia silviterrae]